MNITVQINFFDVHRFEEYRMMINLTLCPLALILKRNICRDELEMIAWHTGCAVGPFAHMFLRAYTALSVL